MIKGPHRLLGYFLKRGQEKFRVIVTPKFIYAYEKLKDGGFQRHEVTRYFVEVLHPNMELRIYSVPRKSVMWLPANQVFMRAIQMRNAGVVK